ncbi:MAG: PepSY-like domain-containing protein [Bacteroidales bacterium]
MKKILFLIMMVMFQLPSFADNNNHYINFNQLPDSLQHFVKKCYGNLPVRKIKQTNSSYKVYFDNYDEITFNKSTLQWTDAESLAGVPVPLLGTLPTKIIEYLIEYHDGVAVVELERLSNNWIGLELTTGEDVLFDSDGVFIQTNHGPGLNDPNRNPNYP